MCIKRRVHRFWVCYKNGAEVILYAWKDSKTKKIIMIFKITKILNSANVTLVFLRALYEYHKQGVENMKIIARKNACELFTSFSCVVIFPKILQYDFYKKNQEIMHLLSCSDGICKNLSFWENWRQFWKKSLKTILGTFLGIFYASEPLGYHQVGEITVP